MDVIKEIEKMIIIDKEIIKLDNKVVEKSINKIYVELIKRNMVMSVITPVVIELINKK